MASAALLDFARSLSPPPFVNAAEYDGWQYRWRFFVFRPEVLKEVLKYEPYAILAFVFYIVFFLYGKYHNSRRANAWLEAHLPLLEQQFSKPTNGGLTKDGYSDFFNFSTGRRGIASLHITFTFRPRHDFLQLAFQTLRSFVDLHYRPRDEIELDFKLAPGIALPDFVWAIVRKDELLTVKKDRWDLTFTRTTDNPALPTTLSVMSEYADVTDNLLKPLGTFSLAKAFEDTAVLSYFRSLSVTDQPRERPTNGPLTASEREKHVILSLDAPSASHVDACIPLVTAMFTFIDSLPKISLRPETKVKIKKAREELDKDLKKELEKEKKDEIAEDRKAVKRKVEEEKVSRLSAAEQKKILEKERKRSIKKSQAKVVRK